MYFPERVERRQHEYNKSIRSARFREALDEAEAKGLIADSKEVRIDIIQRIESCEITPEQGLEELKSIKDNAKKNGQITNYKYGAKNG